MSRRSLLAIATLSVVAAAVPARAQTILRIDGFALGMLWTRTATSLPCEVSRSSARSGSAPALTLRRCSVNDSVSVQFSQDSLIQIDYWKSELRPDAVSVADTWRTISVGVVRLLGAPDSVTMSTGGPAQTLTAFWSDKLGRAWRAHACVTRKVALEGSPNRAFYYRRELTIERESPLAPTECL